MIAYADALQLVLDRAELYKLKSEQISVVESVGRHLAENIIAKRDQPPFHRVAMDGFAVNAKGFNLHKKCASVQQTIYAGDSQILLNQDSGAIEIMTGAILPVGCDAVIPYERTRLEDGIIHTNTEVVPWQNIHQKGADCKAGDIVIATGSKITSLHLSAIKTFGYDQITVTRKIKILIVSTGSELYTKDGDIPEHMIYPSNAYYLQSVLDKPCLETKLIIIKDDQVNSVFSEHFIYSDYDIIITTGGVSMGKKDELPQLFQYSGAEKIFHKVDQKPGKPLWFGALKDKTIFGLPGNPNSCMVCLHAYIIPFINQILGTNKTLPTCRFVPMINDQSGKTYFHSAIVYNEKGTLTAIKINSNGSGDVIAGLAANALVIENESSISHGVSQFIPIDNKF